jgi:myosin protein heavy chain
LVGAQEKLRAKDLETRELEATLESLSHKSDTFNARGTKLEKEKITLEARVRELEGNLRQLSSPAPTAATPARQRVAARRRSSSVSDTKIITLEQDLKDTRASLAQRETELRGATAKLAQAQTDLVKVENEKLATDKRLHAEIRDLRAALQEKNEDLEYMQGQQGGDGREEELLKRIEEDEAKIAALEKLLVDTPETQALKEQLRRLDQKLLIESERVLETEGRHIELVREKEEALDEVEEAQAQIAKLSEALRRKEAVIENLNAKQRCVIFRIKVVGF